MFRSEIGSGFEDPGGTPPPRIPRSTPPPRAPTARNICTRAVFAISSFKFGLPNYTDVTEEEFFKKKVEQSCLTVVWQMTCQRSHICWCLSCRHLVFVLFRSACFGSFKNKFCLASPETDVAFLQEDYSTHQFA